MEKITSKMSTMELREDRDRFEKQMIEEMNIDPLTEIISMVKYQGFNPVELKNFLAKCEKDSCRMIKDCQFLICAYLTVGNTAMKILSKLNASSIFKVYSLIWKYKINDNLKLNKSNETVTWARILSTFPDFTISVLLLQADKIQRPVPLTLMTSLGYTNFPKFLQTSCIYSVIPSNPPEQKEKKAIHACLKAALHHHFEESKVFYKKKHPDMNRTITYAKVSYEYPIMVQSEREKFFSEIMKEYEMTTFETWIKVFDKAFPEFANCHIVYFDLKV